jgi:hypothetical protein
MTTKPKTRKSAPKAAAPKGTPQNNTKIELLMARYKWLEADQVYQAAIAQTDEQSDKLIGVHGAEQNKIVPKLAAQTPKSVEDIFLLLAFVVPSLKDGVRTDGHDMDIMQNVLNAFYSVWRDELAAVRKEAEAKAIANVHAGYRMACDVLERGDKLRQAGVQ